MEPKKNPKYDVHRRRGMLLNVGLIVSLILVITAFEWAIPFTHSMPDLPNRWEETETLITDNPRSTAFKNLEAPKPKHIRPSSPIANIKEIKDVGITEVPVPLIDQNQTMSPLTAGLVDIPKEIVPPDTFVIVEKMPEPVGGWETFYKTLQKNTKYPRQAERRGTRGKVYVEFIVNHKGELSNVKIVKGIGNGCDEEACRVIGLTKWNPGKQRGRPVNVRLVQPLSFNLQDF